MDKKEEVPIPEKVVKNEIDYKYEKKLGSYVNLTLTTKRIIKEVEGFFGYDIKEIPLNKISSITYNSEMNKSLLAFGVFLVIVGWLLSNSSDKSVIHFIPAVNRIIVPLFIIGGVIIIYAFLATNKMIVFGSSSLKITETTKKTGLKEFLEKVRKEIYK